VSTGIGGTRRVPPTIGRVPFLSCEADRMRDPTAEEYARGRLDEGSTAEEVARELISRGAGPIETIKALRATTSMGLDRLKPIVDRALPLRQREANDRLRTQIIELLEGSVEHLVSSEGRFSNIQARGDGPYACPCCGYFTLSERGADEICQVCYWHDDGQDDHDAATVRGGPNHGLSLNQGRANFTKIGACSEGVLSLVRSPRSDEQRKH
jgi:Cysteine-rich CPCC